MNKTEDLEHIISPTFTFKTELNEEKNFAQYVAHVRSIVENMNIVVDHISSEDDLNFIITYTVELTRNTAEYGKKITDVAKILVKDGLIQYFEIGYMAK